MAENYAYDSDLTIQGSVGIGTPSLGAKLEIRGETSDTTGSALRVTNSSGATLLDVQDDRNIHIGGEISITGRGGHSLTMTSALEDDRWGLYDLQVDGLPIITSDSADEHCRIGNNTMTINPHDHQVKVAIPYRYDQEQDERMQQLPRLDVDGQLRIRGGNPGAGKVLTSDLSGLASWKDPQILGIKDPRWTDETYGIYCTNQNVRIMKDPETQWNQIAEDLPRLEVDGQIRITGGEPGTGRVLTCDSAGTAKWEDLENLGMLVVVGGHNDRGNILTCDGGTRVGWVDPDEFVRSRLLWTRVPSTAGVNPGGANCDSGMCLGQYPYFATIWKGSDRVWCKIGQPSHLNDPGLKGQVDVLKGQINVTDSRGYPSISLLGESGDIRLYNADCAEEFDISDSEEVEPGTVMVLDREGRLLPSTTAYDKKVAGVISGAGDYKPGIVLDRKPPQGNRMPVALMGKAFCKVDAQHAPIEVGDLLTTSPTPGHAMKADDPLKAFGAVIGKALHPMEKGQGLIPIMVALQ